MDGEVGPALGELTGAVEGIDDPDPVGPQAGTASAAASSDSTASAGRASASAARISSWDRRSPRRRGPGRSPPGAAPGARAGPGPTARRLGGQRVIVGGGQSRDLAVIGAGRVDDQMHARTGSRVPPGYRAIVWSMGCQPRSRDSTSCPISRHSRPSRSTSCQGGGGRIRAARPAVLGRQGLGRHAAAGREGLLAGAPAVPGDARRHRPQLPRGARLPRPPGGRARGHRSSWRRSRSRSTPAG